MHVTMEHAEAAIQGARKKALELETQMCIAIVDSVANLKVSLRMDDASTVRLSSKFDSGQGAAAF